MVGQVVVVILAHGAFDASSFLATARVLRFYQRQLPSCVHSSNKRHHTQHTYRPTNSSTTLPIPPTSPVLCLYSFHVPPTQMVNPSARRRRSFRKRKPKTMSAATMATATMMDDISFPPPLRAKIVEGPGLFVSGAGTIPATEETAEKKEHNEEQQPFEVAEPNPAETAQASPDIGYVWRQGVRGRVYMLFYDA